MKFDTMTHRFFVRDVFLVSLLCLMIVPGLAEREPTKPVQPVPDPLMEGKAALEDGLYDLARKKLEKVLQSSDTTPAKKREGMILLAQALYGQKRYQEMLNLFKERKEQTPRASQADAFDFWLAAAYFESGQCDEALDSILAFEKNYPDSRYLPRVLRLRAWSYENLGKREEAIKCFARFAEQYGQSPEGPSNLLDWGQALMAVGQDAKARDVLEQLLSLNLKNRVGQECRISLGKLYTREGNLEKACIIFQPLMDQDNVSEEFRASAFYSLADIAEAQTNLVKALSLLDKAIEQLSDMTLKGEVNLRKGKLLLKMGQIDNGIALVRGFVSSQSTNAIARDVQLGLAEILLSKGMNEKALQEYQNFLETFSAPAGVAQAHEGKGWALFALGRYHESVASFEKAADLSTNPGDKARCWFKVGDSYFAAKQFKPAKESYERVMMQCPETPMADQSQFQAAECMAQLGEMTEAESCFWDLIDKDGSGPLAAPALLRIAELKEKEGKRQDALDVYTLVLKNYDRQAAASALHSIGAIQYRSGNFQEALNNFNEVMKSFPGSSVADKSCYMRGWCHYMLGQNDQAVGRFREFIKQYSKSPLAADALFWMSEYDYNRGFYAQAETGFVTLVQENPGSLLADSALFWAGRAALMQKEYRRANDHFSLLIKEYPASKKRPEARCYQGEALCELGEFAGAILIFDEIIKQFPESYLSEMAWFRKGDSQFTLGSEDPKRYEEAIISYHVVLDRPGVSEQSRMQAEYKIGRCLEKLGQRAEAFEHYMNVVYTYFKNQDSSHESNVWFTRAAFNAAAMKEEEKSWGKAVNIYQRVIDARVPASRDATEKINKIRVDHWLFFY